MLRVVLPIAHNWLTEPGTNPHLHHFSACRWAAVLGVILAISRGFITEPVTAFDPELAMLEVVAHTHYLPRHWRGRAHTREVQQQFMALFQFKVGRTIAMF